jgi:hypothetical protein
LKPTGSLCNRETVLIVQEPDKTTVLIVQEPDKTKSSRGTIAEVDTMKRIALAAARAVPDRISSL